MPPGSSSGDVRTLDRCAPATLAQGYRWGGRANGQSTRGAYPNAYCTQTVPTGRSPVRPTAGPVPLSKKHSWDACAAFLCTSATNFVIRHQLDQPWQPCPAVSSTQYSILSSWRDRSRQSKTILLHGKITRLPRPEFCPHFARRRIHLHFWERRFLVIFKGRGMPKFASLNTFFSRSGKTQKIVSRSTTDDPKIFFATKFYIYFS